MNRSSLLWSLALVALPVLAACGQKAPPDEPLVGPYSLHARADPAERIVCIQRAESCVQDVLPGPTVAAVGFDQRHLVIVRAPPGGGAEEYFYVVRHPEEQSALGAEAVHGPLTAEAFAAEQAKLRLPQVSQRF